MGLSLGRVLGIAAICLAGACAPASAPVSGPAPVTIAPESRGGWGLRPPALRVMPLGDSITYGVGSSDGAGYRARLQNELTAAGFRVDFVGSRDSGPAGADDDNEGHSGWTISRLSRRVDRWLAAYRPDVVLLHIGTNDVRSDRYRAGASRRLGVLLNRMRRDCPTAFVYVARIAGSRQPDLQRRIDAYNRGLARVVGARRDPFMRLVDQTTVRAPRLHPNDAGYAAMADNWFAALTEPPLRDLGAVVAGNGRKAPIRLTTTPRSRGM